MVISYLFVGITGLSILCALLTGSGGALAAACVTGAQAGVTMSIALCGSLCLWSGIGNLMTRTGVTEALSRWLRPLLQTLFPSTKRDPILAQALSANFCANLLGLGNAATPMGITAAKRLNRDGFATDELCRLIVLNPASIQLIPTNVAALRSSLGCSTPFDILPAVWITSLLSASLGVGAAFLFAKVGRR